MPPLFSETSRSADCHRGKRRLFRSSRRLPDDADFRHQLDALPLQNALPDLPDQPLDVGGARRALRIDDEIGVLLRYPGAAALESLEPQASISRAA